MTDHMDEFAGRLALVTGAASGIGLATAKALASRGARLVLVDRDPITPQDLDLTTDGIVVLGGDVSDETFWNSHEAQFEGLHYAVVNAGVSGAGSIAEFSFAEWRRILSVNLDGAFLTLRAVFRSMADGGAIAVTASAAGLKAEPGVAAYGASKAALIHLAKVAAKEGATRRIRVNAIAPGGVETPVWRDMAFFKDLVSSTGSEAAAFAALANMATPLGRYARSEEIAEQICFLLSDAAATITGTVLTSDGGYTL